MASAFALLSTLPIRRWRPVSICSGKPLKKSFDRKVILIFVAIVLDAVATVWLMAQGLGEANPIMSWLAGLVSPVGMAIVKIVWSAGLLFMLMRLEEFKRYIDYLIIGYFLLYAGGWLVQFIMEATKWTP
jgi:hypothetical protein